MRRWTACVLVCVLAAGMAHGAQISGFIDVSHTWNLDNPPGSPNLLRHYDSIPDSVFLNAAHVEVKDEFSENARYKIELDAGFNPLWETGGVWNVDVQEAYIDAKAPESSFGLRAGKFESLCGMESMDSPANATMSRGLLFTHALPRSYTGALLTYSGEQFDIALGGVNGWDRNILDNNATQTLVANVGIRPDRRFGVRLGYMNGPEDGAGNLDRSTIDLVVSFEVERQAEFSIEYTTTSEETAGADDEWSGIAFQALFRGSRGFSMGFRYESLDDPDAALIAAGPGEYSSITLGPAFDLSRSTTLRFEVRIDKADFNYFTDADGNPTDTQKTLAVELFTTF